MSESETKPMTEMSREDQIRFLMTDIYRPELAIRTSNCLRNNGFTTLFTALSMTEKEFNRSPNVGKRTVEDFKRFLTEHGLRMGETDSLCTKYSRALFIGADCNPPANRGDKAIGDITTREHISRSELEKIVTEFLDTRMEISTPKIGENKMETQPSDQDSTPDMSSEWIQTTLPVNLKNKLHPSVLREIFNTREFQGSIRTDVQAIREKAIAAIVKDLGLDKT